MPQPGWFKQQTYFSQFSEQGSSRSRCQHICCLVMAQLPEYRNNILLEESYKGVENKEEKA